MEKENRKSFRSSMYATLSRCGDDDVEVEVFYVVSDEIVNERNGRRS